MLTSMSFSCWLLTQDPLPCSTFPRFSLLLDFSGFRDIPGPSDHHSYTVCIWCISWSHDHHFHRQNSPASQSSHQRFLFLLPFLSAEVTEDPQCLDEAWNMPLRNVLSVLALDFSLFTACCSSVYKACVDIFHFSINCLFFTLLERFLVSSSNQFRR